MLRIGKFVGLVKLLIIQTPPR